MDDYGVAGCTVRKRKSNTLCQKQMDPKKTTLQNIKKSVITFDFRVNNKKKLGIMEKGKRPRKKTKILLKKIL